MIMLTQIPNPCQIYDMDWCKKVWICYLLYQTYTKHAAKRSKTYKMTNSQHLSANKLSCCVSAIQQIGLGKDIDLKMEDNGWD